MKLAMTMPRLRLWHLVGMVAASAALFAVIDFRWSVSDPIYVALKRLRSSNPEERIRATRDLGSIRPPARQALEPLLEALNDGDARVRKGSSLALLPVVEGETDKARLAAVKAGLKSALRDKDRDARRAAALSLGALVEESSVVVPVLIESMREASAEDRRNVVNILMFHVAKNKEARATIFAGLKDPDYGVRGMAVSGLAYCLYANSGNRDPEIVAALIPLLADPNAYVRAHTVRVLAGYAGKYKVEIPQLQECWNDSDSTVRHASIYSHDRTDSSSAWINFLIRTTQDPVVVVRTSAITKLKDLGADAEEALPALRRAKEDPDGNVCNEAQAALETVEAKVREFHEKLLPELLQDLRSGSSEDKRQSIELLGNAGRKAVPAIPELILCLDDPEPSVRQAAADALARFGGEAKDAIPALTRHTEDADQQVGKAAKAALAKLH